MGGVEMGERSDGSGDWGLYSSLSSRVRVTTAIVFRMLNGFSGRFKSFRLGGTIGSCRPNPYGIAGSFESSSMVKIWGSRDTIDDTDAIRAFVPCDAPIARLNYGCSASCVFVD